MVNYILKGQKFLNIIYKIVKDIKMLNMLQMYSDILCTIIRKKKSETPLFILIQIIVQK